MSNERYLALSYVVVGAVAFALGITVYLWLRGPLIGTTIAVSPRQLGRTLRRFFPVGIIAPALGGFLSVSFRSCEKSTYTEIIADRAYLVAKNQEQISAASWNLALAVLVWGFVVTGALIVSHSTVTSRRWLVLSAAFVWLILVLLTQ